MKHSLPLVLGALLVACNSDKDATPNADSASTIPMDTQHPQDADADGVSVEDGDCDDSDPDIHPGRAEDCNGVDDNCNEIIDEGFGDADEDGTADCMDSEDCDALDNDGDGGVDEGFPDADGDGVADCVGVETCDGLDNDADGLVDEGFDADNDGVLECEDDCDDNDATAFPGNTEIEGDGVDNDCDGLTDETGWEEGSLVITEIMNNPGGTSDPNGEYFEVYNPGDADITVDGFWITSDDDVGHQIPSGSGVVVPAGGYALFSGNGDTSTNGNMDVTYEYSDISLSNESDTLALVADGTTLDSVSWDDGATMPDPDGGSINLDPWMSDSTLNDDVNNWCVSLDPWVNGGDAGSPGSENELCSHIDHDEDGFTRDEGDCDDANARVYPGAPELDTGVDNDCDGEVEVMPIAVADYDSSSSNLQHCSYVYLSGSGSYDPDSSGTLSYDWSLTSAPSGSSATTSDITDTTDADPTFTPDVSGTYVFTLTVNDGGADSYPDTLSITITSATSNDSPVADAGEDADEEGEVTCQSVSYGAYYTCDDCSDQDFELDGTGSTDNQSADWMTYSWAITSGSSYGSLDSTTSATPTLTVSGVSATYGSDTDQDVVVGLTVTDCYGADSSQDTVTLTMTCTGS